MYSEFIEKFKLIELKRKHNLQHQLNQLINQRALDKQTLITRIQEYNKKIIQSNNSIIEEIKLAHIKAIEEKERKIEQENMSLLNVESENKKITDLQTRILIDDTQFISNIESKSILENEKIEIVESITPRLTNIPLSEELIQKYVAHHPRPMNIEITRDMMDAKRVINKRVSQVSNDIDHIKKVSKDVLKYTHDPELNKMIAELIIRQGKLQVAVHNDSYKGYSYFFVLIYNDNLMQDFRYKVLTDESVDNSLTKGVYLVYFGILKLHKSFDEAWFFFASMMNVKPIEKSLYVLESFLIVLGSDLKHFYGDEFGKIQKFICDSYWNEVDNLAVKTRIRLLFTKLESS